MVRGAVGLLLLTAGSALAQPMMIVTVKGLPFGTVRVGKASPPAEIRIENGGDADLDIAALVLAGNDPRDFALAGPGSFTVHPGDSQAVGVTFTPSRLGLRDAEVVVVPLSPRVPAAHLALQGTGGQGQLVADPVGLAFDPVRLGDSPLPLGLVLKNNGVLDVTVTALAIDGGAPSPFSLLHPPVLPLVIPALQAAVLSVQFVPATSGRSSSELVVTSDRLDGASPLSVALEAYAGAPTVGALPTSLGFPRAAIGDVSERRDVRITSDEAIFQLPVTVSGVRFPSSGGVSEFRLAEPAPGFPLVLQHGKEALIGFAFAPGGAGDRHGTVEILSDDPVHPALSITLSGYGDPLRLSPAQLVFVPTALGATSTPLTVTLENRDGVPHTVSSVRLAGRSPEGFTVAPAGPFPVAAGAKATLAVRFAPAEDIEFHADLVVEIEGGQPLTTGLTGTTTTPLFTASPLRIDFGTVAPGSAVPPVTVTIRNNGLDPLELDPVASPDPTFTLDTHAVPVVMMGRTSATFTVTFHPGRVGSYRASVPLGVKGRPTAQLSVDLAGSAQEPRLAADSGCALAPPHRPSAAVLALPLLVLLAALRRSRRVRLQSGAS